MKDDVVPYSNATALYNLLQEQGIVSELITYPDSGHGLEANPDSAERATEAFYRYAKEYLK